MDKGMQQSQERTFSADAGTRGIVAIVEDDPHICEVLGLWLELHGLQATRHSNGESLLHAIHQGDQGLTLAGDAGDPAEYPLLGAVLDLNLPSITGVDLAHALRNLAPRLPVAIITALNDDERHRYGDAPTGIRCLRKPFSLEALEEALSPLFH